MIPGTAFEPDWEHSRSIAVNEEARQKYEPEMSYHQFRYGLVPSSDLKEIMRMAITSLSRMVQRLWR